MKQEKEQALKLIRSKLEEAINNNNILTSDLLKLLIEETNNLINSDF